MSRKYLHKNKYSSFYIAVTILDLFFKTLRKRQKFANFCENISAHFLDKLHIFLFFASLFFCFNPNCDGSLL